MLGVLVLCKLLSYDCCLVKRMSADALHNQRGDIAPTVLSALFLHLPLLYDWLLILCNAVRLVGMSV